MLILIRTELKKAFKQKVTKGCFILLILVMLSVIVTEFQDVSAFRTNEAYRNELLSWQEREQNLIKYGSESLEDDWYSPLQKEQISKRIAIAQYRLDHAIPKDIYKNVWWFFNDNTFNVVATFTIVMLIIIGSVSIAGEYSSHTFRQVLLLPYKRYKILLAKLVSLGLVGLILYSLVFLMGLISGFILHGTNGLTSQVVLYSGQHITTMNMSLYSLLIVLFKSVEILFFATFVLFLSVLIKTPGITMLITGAIAIFAQPIGHFLGSYYPSVYYLPFLNLDFRRYLDFGTTMPALENFWGNVVIEGITPILSTSIVIGSILIMIGTSFYLFKTQDL